MRWPRPLWGLAVTVVAGSLFFPLPVSAAEEISVSAQVDKSEVRQGEQFLFEIVISGEVRETPRVRIGLLEGFKVVSTAQSQQVQVRAGKVSQTITFTTSLLALEAGDRVLGPVQVEIQDKKLETRPVKVKVLPGSAPRPPELEGEVIL